MMTYSKRFDVKIAEKRLLTLEETAALYGIGINKLRRLSDKADCPFVLWNGSKRLIKKQQFDEFLAKQYSI